ncbi:hypothetical protein MJO28_007013 [Puccinia striiformis f. sp. tritici]|uniref:Uncharacterized protein n=1 Tax=Puccinia striiformis f. sp. tritici TaxID=168172 RepID=A0ACC0EEY7_9BASI|nr:hypothetical protein MJO28_007013 [Puccinia striiformis f. sp. tritici]
MYSINGCELVEGPIEIDSEGQVQIFVTGTSGRGTRHQRSSQVIQYLIICHPIPLNTYEAGPWLHYYGQVSPEQGSNPIIVHANVATWRAHPPAPSPTNHRPEFTGTITLTTTRRRITGTVLSDQPSAINCRQTPTPSVFVVHVDDLFMDMYGAVLCPRQQLWVAGEMVRRDGHELHLQARLAVPCLCVRNFARHRHAQEAN